MFELLIADPELLSTLPLLAGRFGWRSIFKPFSIKKITSVAKAIIKKPTKIVTAPITAGRKAIKQTGANLKDAAKMFSINPPGTPLSRGDIPAIPKPLPAAPQTPGSGETPTQVASRKLKRRRGTKTVLTGPRGLATSPGVSSGKKLFGG